MTVLFFSPSPQRRFGLGILQSTDFWRPLSASKMAGDRTGDWPRRCRAIENWANFGFTECGYLCIHYVPACALYIMYIHMHAIHRHTMHIHPHLDTCKCNSVGAFKSQWGVWSHLLPSPALSWWISNMALGKSRLLPPLPFLGLLLPAFLRTLPLYWFPPPLTSTCHTTSYRKQPRLRVARIL